MKAMFFKRQTANASLALLVLLICAFVGQAQSPLVNAVDSIGLTVSDVDRSVEFFSKVLSFEKVSDMEVTGEAYEHLQGVFGVRMRIVRMETSTGTRW